MYFKIIYLTGIGKNFETENKKNFKKSMISSLKLSVEAFLTE
jgi:hypothetical protein